MQRRRRSHRRRAGRLRDRLGTCRLGQRVAVLDEGDVAYRASRGNFALVWVQSKGLGMAAYAGWTKRSSDGWSGLRSTTSRRDRHRCRLPAAGWLPRSRSPSRSWKIAPRMLRGCTISRTWCLTRTRSSIMPALRGCCPTSAPRSPAAAIVRSTGIAIRCVSCALCMRHGAPRRGLSAQPPQSSTSKPRRANFVCNTRRRGACRQDRARRRQRQRAAGTHGRACVRRCGRSAGRSWSTERVRPFLHYPVVTVRQTDEGGVMLGDSLEEVGFDDTVGTGGDRGHRRARRAHVPAAAPAQRRAHAGRRCAS